jgi:hypothetical protein
MWGVKNVCAARQQLYLLHGAPVASRRSCPPAAPPRPRGLVNARFDRVAEEQARYIVEHTGMTASDVLKQSVAEMYDRAPAR